MDAHDIFLKLSSGVRFNKKAFPTNNLKKAEIKPSDLCGVKIKSEPIDSDDNVIKSEPIESNVNEIKSELLDNFGTKIKSEHSSDNDESDFSPVHSNVTDQTNLTLLGNIKAEDEHKKRIKLKKLQKGKVDGNTAQTVERDNINRFRNINGISLTGKHIPNPIETFEQLLSSEYGVSPKLINNIKACGYSAPTPIQMQAIPVLLKGRQLLACAPTGSGKTAAFLIPIINHLKRPSRNGFRALIVCPTRELARQIFRECNQLADGTGLCVFLISKISQKQIALGENFYKKHDIIVTTPNRLIYLLKQETPIQLKTVEWLIVDESDKLFEVGVRGFREQLADIYRSCDSANVKRAMFSATHTHHVAKWCKKNLEGLISVTVGHRNTATDLVEQKFVFVGNEHGKLIAFRNLIHEGLHPPVLVFVQSKDRAKSLFSELIYDGINVDVIHADRTQFQRDNVIKAFREGKIWVLICTELMGRGIDFKGVNLVINYDFPQTAISYIHRIGRTGRAGRPGKAITFFSDVDKPLLRSIAVVMKDSGCNVPDFMVNLKKPSKKLKRKLENTVPKRKSISVIPRLRKNIPVNKERTKTVKSHKKNKKNKTTINE